jgi:hypothetical protein
MKILQIHRVAVIYGLFALPFTLMVSEASADDYLQEINSEAGDLATFEGSSEPGQPMGNDEQAAQRRKLLEARLKKELSNTYTIYRKLTATQKALVVESYYASGEKISVASRQIFNIYFKEGNH